VPKAEIAGNGYDLSINRYKEVVHGAVEHDPPDVILVRLAELERTIRQGMTDLEALLRTPANTDVPAN
jgi:type I restriction enzyme M protein